MEALLQEIIILENFGSREFTEKGRVRIISVLSFCPCVIPMLNQSVCVAENNNGSGLAGT